MRCKEVIRRINDSIDVNQEMQEHIDSCPSCARAYEAARILGEALDSEKEKSIQSTPFSEFRDRINKRAAEKKKESIMSIMKNQINRRSGLVTGLSLAVIAFLFITLVPFSYSTTVGYELTYSIPGDNINISPTRLNEALVALGYNDLSINMTDGRCAVKGLPSRRAAHEASIAFTALSGYGGDFNIKPIAAVVSGSLYAQVVDKYKIEVKAEGKSDAEIAEEVRQQLLEKGYDSAKVTVSTSANGEQIDIHVSGDYSSEDGEKQQEMEIQLIDVDDGDISFGIDDPNDDMKFDFDTENMTDAEVKAAIDAKLAAEGKGEATVEVTTTPDGQRDIKISIEKEETKGE